MQRILGAKGRSGRLRSASRLISINPYATAILEKPPSGGFFMAGI
jgi:hypothetical protein